MLQEIFSQHSPPNWFSDREVKQCEDAVAALPAEARLQVQLEEEETPSLELFWAEVQGDRGYDLYLLCMYIVITIKLLYILL